MSGRTAQFSRPKVLDGDVLRVRRLRGVESEHFRVPLGLALVGVAEVAVLAPLEQVAGREDELVDALRRVEQDGPEGAARFLDQLRHRGP